MKHVSRLADLISTVIDLVQHAVGSCKVCSCRHAVGTATRSRQWARPLSEWVASVEVTTQINHQVGLDLMFYSKNIILHMLDRCAGWYADKTVPGKDMASIIAAIHDKCVSIHRAMQELIVDGEKPIESWQANTYFGNHTTKVIHRAPSQNARFIERRGALTRNAAN